MSDAGITIVSMLSHVFGVDRLRDLSKEFEARAKRVNRETDELRKNLRDTPSRHHAYERIALQERADDLKGRIEQLRRQSTNTDRLLGRKMAWITFLSDEQRYMQALEVERESVKDLWHRLRDLLPELNIGQETPDSREGIRRLLRRVSERRDYIIMSRGRIEAEREAALRYIEMLGSTEPICPVCRRPMSAEDAANAIQEHQGLATSYVSELSQYGNEIETLERFTRDLTRLLECPEPTAPTQPGEPPTDYDLDNIQSDLIRQKTDLTNLENQEQEVATQLATLEQLGRERQDDAVLTNRLLEGYRAAERAQLASATMSQLADAICAERISPLTSELEKRWPQLSTGTSLSMSDLGELALTENGHKIPYSELSGGQRTLVQLATRLLALQMGTRSPFLVLDEPLEHLDPRNRRSLATLLVQATRTSTRLRQVLVTTYEESVTRRLSSAPVDGGRSGAASAEGFGANVVRIASA
jgi:DNA repair exonuclease SbcCD ATPase subunit